MIDALRAQALHPSNDRRRVEAELRDDGDAEADLSGGLELCGEQPIKLKIGDTRMAVGIARDADFADAAACNQT